MSDRVKSRFEWELLERKNGEQSIYIRMVHLSRRLRSSDEKTNAFLNAVGQIEGVEGVEPQGPYMLALSIGRCFDVDVVEKDIEAEIERFLSDIVVPNNKVKLITDESS